MLVNVNLHKNLLIFQELLLNSVRFIKVKSVKQEDKSILKDYSDFKYIVNVLG